MRSRGNRTTTSHELVLLYGTPPTGTLEPNADPAAGSVRGRARAWASVDRTTPTFPSRNVNHHLGLKRASISWRRQPMRTYIEACIEAEEGFDGRARTAGVLKEEKSHEHCIRQPRRGGDRFGRPHADPHPRRRWTHPASARNGGGNPPTARRRAAPTHPSRARGDLLRDFGISD